MKSQLSNSSDNLLGNSEVLIGHDSLPNIPFHGSYALCDSKYIM